MLVVVRGADGPTTKDLNHQAASALQTMKAMRIDNAPRDMEQDPRYTQLKERVLAEYPDLKGVALHTLI